MAAPISSNSTPTYTPEAPVNASPDKSSVPGSFSLSDDKKVVFTLKGSESDKPAESLGELIRASANDILTSNKSMGTHLVEIMSEDFSLLQKDLKFVDLVSNNGAPLYQELENLEAILLPASTSGEMHALVNFNGGEHATAALNYLHEFISFSVDSGVSNENFDSALYAKAESAINKTLNGEAPSKDEVAAMRAVVSAAKVPMESYSYANLASLLQSTAHDMERIKGGFARVTS